MIYASRPNDIEKAAPAVMSTIVRPVSLMSGLVFALVFAVARKQNADKIGHA
jgi:hypothetical protein